MAGLIVGSLLLLGAPLVAALLPALATVHATGTFDEVDPTERATTLADSLAGSTSLAVWVAVAMALGGALLLTVSALRLRRARRGLSAALIIVV